MTMFVSFDIIKFLDRHKIKMTADPSIVVMHVRQLQSN